jgi:rRNA maturation RNase YbeY
MISFNTEDLSFTLKKKAIIKKWIKSIIESKKQITGDIAFVFCSDDYLLEVNKTHLNHDTLTDVITFDYTDDDPKQAISGDILISIERIKENATKFNQTFDNELNRVMIHGVLHLLGYKDKNDKDQEEMTKQEDLSLALFQKVSF